MSIEKFIRKACVQTAVYWGHPIDNGYGGMIYNDPVEIPCRWEDVATLITASDGEQYVTKASILTPNELDVNGYLMLGHLIDIDSNQLDKPLEIASAHRIRRFSKVPLFRSTTTFVKEAFI